MSDKSTKAGVFLLSLSLSLAAGCAPTDDERCGDGFVFQDDTCVPLEGEDTDEDTDSGDGGPDGGTGPSGLGDTCTPAGNECAGLDADYCAVIPGQDEGYCTVKDCSTNPDDCWGDYTCCDFPYQGVPNFCVTPEDLALLGSTCDG